MNPENSSPLEPNVVLLTNDLMGASRVTGAAGPLQLSADVAWNPDQLQEKSARAALVILDLASPFDLAGVVAMLKARNPPPRVVAFGPHVQHDRLHAAAAAGCDAVLARGDFHARLPEILRWAAP